jgi:poly-gamma-glutamate system protein
MRSSTPGLRWIYVLGAAGLAFYAAERMAFPGRAALAETPALQASRLMERAVAALAPCAEARGVRIDPSTDLNRTGIIGLPSSPITTSPGQLEAKRTAANPNFAGCLVRMLDEAGVRRGDAVAIGASSSFPALIVATLSAVQAIGARPVMISSLGASNWGANNPAFTQLEMLDCLRSAGVLDVRPIALAVGGENDDGSDMSEEGRAFVREKIRAMGLPVIDERDLASDVRARMAIYEAAASGARIAAFVNVGGSWANMGVDSRVLKLEPGLTEVRDVPPVGKRGVIQEMASRGVPVIHLLYVKGLAERCGLPWDPVPLPQPGEGGGPRKGASFAGIGTLLLVLYLVLSAAILARLAAYKRLTTT